MTERFATALNRYRCLSRRHRENHRRIMLAFAPARASPTAGLAGAECKTSVLRWLLRSARFRAPDLEIVEEAVFAHAAELDLGLGRVGDAGGLREGDGFAVDGGAQGVVYGFEQEGVPDLGIEAEGEGDVLSVGGRGWFAGGAFGAGEGEAFLVHEGDLVCGDARRAEVPVVRAVELPVVNLRRDGLRAAELEAELDHAVLRPDVVADDGRMPFHRGLALLRRGIEAHLRALQRAVLVGIRRHHDGPAFVLAQLSALEVIGKEQFLLLRDRLRGNGGQLRRIGGEGGGGDEAGEREEAEVHGDEGADSVVCRSSDWGGLSPLAPGGSFRGAK